MAAFQGLGLNCIEKSITDTDLDKRLRMQVAADARPQIKRGILVAYVAASIY